MQSMCLTHCQCTLLTQNRHVIEDMRRLLNVSESDGKYRNLLFSSFFPSPPFSHCTAFPLELHPEITFAQESSLNPDWLLASRDLEFAPIHALQAQILYH